MSRVDSESCFAIFLARILWQMRLASRENISESLASYESRKEGKMRYIVKLVSLTICESRNLRDSQTRKIIIHSEKFWFLKASLASRENFKT
jgi:hypothetical protein